MVALGPRRGVALLSHTLTPSHLKSRSRDAAAVEAMQRAQWLQQLSSVLLCPSLPSIATIPCVLCFPLLPHTFGRQVLAAH